MLFDWNFHIVESHGLHRLDSKSTWTLILHERATAQMGINITTDVTLIAQGGINITTDLRLKNLHKWEIKFTCLRLNSLLAHQSARPPASRRTRLQRSSRDSWWPVSPVEGPASRSNRLSLMFESC